MLSPLSVEELLTIHNEMVTAFTKNADIRDYILLESASIAPFQTIFGEDAYPSVFDKAAKYMFDFANYQIFVDGNKRISVGSAYVFLMENGIKLTLSEKDMFDLIIGIATNKIDDISKVSDILKNNHTVLPANDNNAYFDSSEDKITIVKEICKQVLKQYNHTLEELAKGPDEQE